MNKDEYQFPDEAENEAIENESKDEESKEPEFSVEIEDDTPEQDRGKQPATKEFVDNLEKDELEEYSKGVQTKIKQFKKVYHDERRAKEAAEREKQEAIDLAKRLYEENKSLKGKVNHTEKFAVDSFKSGAEQELAMAKKDYREAYDAGDSERLVDAQERMTSAKMKVDRALNAAENIQNRRPEQEEVFQPVQQRPVVDSKAATWQSRNDWFGQDDEMTSLALGLHEKLVKENGMAYATTDEYYKRIDATIRRRFPEKFEDDDDVTEVTAPSEKTAQRKPSTVVASAARSTNSKRIRLTTSQQSIAKKLGLTPEQYARELLKMEA
jgi:hypothetical protein